MAAPRTARPHLSDAELREMLDLIHEADSVELKATVKDADQQRTAVALGVDPLDAQIRQVFFFDTPDLALEKSGLVVRARRVQAKGDDSVVKLRPVIPHELPERLRREPSFFVEVDAMPGGFVCSASFKQALGPKSVRRVAMGKEPVSSLFSEGQRAFFAEHAGGLELDDLAILGPIFVLKLKYAPKGFDRKIVAELWLYPDGERILELSTKCLPSETFDVAAETSAFLTGRDIDLSGGQRTKTRTALEFFAARLAKT